MLPGLTATRLVAGPGMTLGLAVMWPMALGAIAGLEVGDVMMEKNIENVLRFLGNYCAF
jgi:hypothetical protein